MSESSNDLHFCTKNVVLCTLALRKRLWQLAHNIQKIFSLAENISYLDVRWAPAADFWDCGLQEKVLGFWVSWKLKSMCFICSDAALFFTEGQKSVFTKHSWVLLCNFIGSQWLWSRSIFTVDANFSQSISIVHNYPYPYACVIQILW